MRQIKSLLVASITALMFSTGCSDAKTSVFVRHVINPDIDDATGGCLYEADPDQSFISEGYLDVGFASTYRAFFSVANQLTPRGDTDTLRAESNRVQFFEVEVEVYDFSGGLLSSYTVPATGFADPGPATNPGYGPVGAVLVDASVTEGFRTGAITANQTIVARAIVRGTSIGGVEVETAPYDFPIFVTNSGSCVDPPIDQCMESPVTNFCYLGQDAIADCRLVEQITGIDASQCN